MLYKKSDHFSYDQKYSMNDAKQGSPIFLGFGAKITVHQHCRGPGADTMDLTSQ